MAVDILTQNYEMVNLFIVHIKVFNEFFETNGVAGQRGNWIRIAE